MRVRNCSEKVSPFVLKTKYVCGVTGLRFCCSDFREFDYFTNPFCYLSVDIVFLVLLRANHCAKMCVAFGVTFIAVDWNNSLADSSLLGFTIIQHFLVFGKYPKSGPIAVRVSHQFFISQSGTSKGRSRTNTERIGWSAAVTGIRTSPKRKVDP